MAFLPTVEAELIVHPKFALLGGDLAGGVGVGAGSEGLGSRSGLVLVLRRPRRRRRRAGRFFGSIRSVGVTLVTLIASHLFLLFPVTVIDLEDAGFKTRESGDSGGVAKTKVLTEVAGETPVQVGPEGFLVPGGLGG